MLMSGPATMANLIQYGRDVNEVDSEPDDEGSRVALGMLQGGWVLSIFLLALLSVELAGFSILISPYVLFLFPVYLAVRLFGKASGISASVLSVFYILYVYEPPSFSLAVPMGVIPKVALFFVGTWIVAHVASAHRTRPRGQG
jgi:K+-sensing histidine kinase KdpD